MPDTDLLAALNDTDPGALRRYVDARLSDAVRLEVQRINDEDDDLVIYGNPNA